MTKVWFEGKQGEALSHNTPVHRVDNIREMKIKGPAVLLMSTSTVIVEPSTLAFINREGSIIMEIV